jgi:hypothetical protein
MNTESVRLITGIGCQNEGSYDPTIVLVNGTLRVTSHHHTQYRREGTGGMSVFLRNPQGTQYVGFEIIDLVDWWNQRLFQKQINISMILERIHDFGDTNILEKAMIKNVGIHFLSKHGLSDVIIEFT